MSIENRVCFQVNWRDGLSCRHCGRAPLSREKYHSGFEYHHLKQRAHGGEDVPENLILLCHDCHTLWHQKKIHLPYFSRESLELRAELICANCEFPNDPHVVEMNCGWYRCGQCREKIHLFEHCGLG